MAFGDTIVITEGPSSMKGQYATIMGQAGRGGESGTAVHGGSLTKPGLSIARDVAIEGKLAKLDGDTLPPAQQVWP
jgi:hypothetical protein